MLKSVSFWGGLHLQHFLFLQTRARPHGDASGYIYMRCEARFWLNFKYCHSESQVLAQLLSRCVFKPNMGATRLFSFAKKVNKMKARFWPKMTLLFWTPNWARTWPSDWARIWFSKWPFLFTICCLKYLRNHYKIVFSERYVMLCPYGHKKPKSYFYRFVAFKKHFGKFFQEVIYLKNPLFCTSLRKAIFTKLADNNQQQTKTHNTNWCTKNGLIPLWKLAKIILGQNLSIRLGQNLAFKMANIEPEPGLTACNAYSRVWCLRCSS